MPVIYLRHPKHGSKVATLDMEAAYDEQHGWERYDPNESAEPVEAAEDDAAPAVKRGRRRRVDESDKDE